jgi:hypothetical protein
MTKRLEDIYADSNGSQFFKLAGKKISWLQKLETFLLLSTFDVGKT